MGKEKNNSSKLKGKLQEKYGKEKLLYNLLKENASDILKSDNFQKTRRHIQHGTMPVHRHCINVAKASIALNKKLGIRCNEKELIRGALLHDYFLYDWHQKSHDHRRLHGFYHPGVALDNADKEYQLTLREKDIIRKHMWPLTVVPPRCREAWVVTTADKWCSLLETFHFLKGKEIIK